MIICDWLSKKHAARASHPLIAVHRAYRRARRVRRLVWTCTVVGPLAATAVAVPHFASPPPVFSPPAATTSGSALPESPWEIPNSVTGTRYPEWPIVSTPGTPFELLPDLPIAPESIAPTDQTPSERIPEPSSLALLLFPPLLAWRLRA